mmetsp:Transcript_65204/g.171412  ORF Transcript_65204/g.171412 Transcript_65204/m.171412 type:complete len:221 (+) Transcript_65204:3-665(+)
MDLEDGTVKKTKIVIKVCEDFRNIRIPKVAKKANAMQGSEGPPPGPDHRYGIKSDMSSYTVGSCIKGYYSLEDQLPDQDLGRCCKPGRRNVTNETRAFGVPSVRSDIAAPPPRRRSIADSMSYGDEPSAAVILNPQRFADKGIPDSDFLIRRTKEDLAELVKNVPGQQVDFEALWEEALSLFDDDLPRVSLDAILFVQSRHIEQNVSKQLRSVRSLPSLR